MYRKTKDEQVTKERQSVDCFGRGALGSDDEVTLVLAVFVVDDDDELARADVVETLCHTCQWHG